MRSIGENRGRDERGRKAKRAKIGRKKNVGKSWLYGSEKEL